MAYFSGWKNLEDRYFRAMIRSTQNPIITRRDIPAMEPDIRDVSSVFNPGATMFNEEYLLLLRVQKRSRETFILKATSTDGIKFTVDSKPVHFSGIEDVGEKIHHIYDPRITKIGDEYFIMFAMDLDQECKLGLGRTKDFSEYQFLGVVSEDDNRNGVLFPEKINGKYLRLDRPNKTQLDQGPASGRTICLSESDDLLKWKQVSQVATGRFHYWDENIGAGPPPIKTRKGWLLIYHGVATHFASSNIYQAGVMLLDSDDPATVIARSNNNILEPRELWELTGQVPNVVFPSGAVVEDFDEDGFAKSDSVLKIYYGAADSVVGLAETTVEKLIAMCHE